MRIHVVSILFAFFVTLGLLPREASAQQPPSAPVVAVSRPYTACVDLPQSEFCANQAWILEQRRAAVLAAAAPAPPAPTPAAPPPPPSPPRHTVTRSQCIEGCGDGDMGCVCRCQGAYLNPQGACQSLTNALASTVAVVSDHERRLQVLERQAGVEARGMAPAVTVARPNRARRRPRRH